MNNFLKHNRNILIIAIAIFMGSLSMLLFFMNEDSPHENDVKTDVIDSVSLKNSQEEEKKYREMVENEEDTLMVVGLDGKIDLVSWDFEGTAGYKEIDLKNRLFFDLLHPEDIGIFLSAFGTVIESEKPLTMVGPYRLRDSNGQYHFHMGSLYPYKKGPKIVKVIITTRDISETLENSKKAPQQNAGDSEINSEEYKSPKIRNEKNINSHPLADKLLSLRQDFEKSFPKNEE